MGIHIHITHISWLKKKKKTQLVSCKARSMGLNLKHKRFLIQNREKTTVQSLYLLNKCIQSSRHMWAFAHLFPSAMFLSMTAQDQRWVWFSHTEASATLPVSGWLSRYASAKVVAGTWNGDLKWAMWHYSKQGGWSCSVFFGRLWKRVFPPQVGWEGLCSTHHCRGSQTPCVW